MLRKASHVLDTFIDSCFMHWLIYLIHHDLCAFYFVFACACGGHLSLFIGLCFLWVLQCSCVCSMSTVSLLWRHCIWFLCHHEVHLLGRNEFSEALRWMHSWMPKCTSSAELQVWSDEIYAICTMSIIIVMDHWVNVHPWACVKLHRPCVPWAVAAVHQVWPSGCKLFLNRAHGIFFDYLVLAKTKPLSRKCVQSVLKPAGIL